MQTFRQHLIEEYLEVRYDNLFEALITFGGKAYPKFGNVVIMAGGAGSGKGFVKDKLVGLEGKTFDVDALKTMSLKAKKIKEKVKKEYGIDLSKLNLRNPKDVLKLHELIGDELGIADKQKKRMYASILAADAERKPNLIFDVTLKNLEKLQKISSSVEEIGYNKRNIHIVWVLNDIRIAARQNVKRDRKVATEILLNTHRGVSQTMGDIIRMGSRLGNYMDGDIVFAFNKVGVDTELVKYEKDDPRNKGGSYIKDANYFYVKRAGKPALKINQLEGDIRNKIKSYVPKNFDWSE